MENTSGQFDYFSTCNPPLNKAYKTQLHQLAQGLTNMSDCVRMVDSELELFSIGQAHHHMSFRLSLVHWQ